MRRKGLWMVLPAAALLLFVAAVAFVRGERERQDNRAQSPAGSPGATAPPPGDSLGEVRPGVDVPVVRASQLKARMERRGALLLAFVGSRKYFEERHIPGAICVEYTDLDRFFGPRDRGEEIVLYCGCCAGKSEGISGAAVRLLKALGFRNVSHLEGHFAAWQSARYPIEGTSPTAPVELAYANDEQKTKLDSFVDEARRRHGELAAAFAAERDAARRSQLQARIGEIDREMEIEGLLLKRKIAEENGNLQMVQDIDRLLEIRGVRVRK